MLESTDKKSQIAVVGLGFGRHIITQLLEGPGAPYFRLAGICDKDRQRAAEVSAKTGARVYADLDEVLADPAVPVVGLYTGPSCRAQLIRKVIRSGKHVMTTKPFELDPDAAMSVLREARELGLIVHLNSPAPIVPQDLEQIAKWRKLYNLGTPVGCRADVWTSYAEQADGSWYDDPDKCPVAPIFRLGIYLINDLVQLFGPAEEVQVFASRLVTGRPTPDNAQLGIRFKSGGLANIFASFAINDGDKYCNSLVLNFQNGTIYRNSGPDRPPIGDVVSELTLVTRVDGVRTVAEKVQTKPSGLYRWDVLNRAVRGERVDDEIPPEQVVDGVKIIHAMAEAYRTGYAVRL